MKQINIFCSSVFLLLILSTVAYSETEVARMTIAANSTNQMTIWLDTDMTYRMQFGGLEGTEGISYLYYPGSTVIEHTFQQTAVSSVNFTTISSGNRTWKVTNLNNETSLHMTIFKP